MQKIRWEEIGTFLKQAKNIYFHLCQQIRKATLIGLLDWPVTLENTNKEKWVTRLPIKEKLLPILHNGGQNPSRIIYSFVYPGSFFY